MWDGEVSTPEARTTGDCASRLAPDETVNSTDICSTGADGMRLLTLIEGGWILSRAYQSKQPMLEAAETYIGSLRGDPN